MNRPVVVVTPDCEEREGRRGPSRLHVLSRDYADAVTRAGGLPFVAPYTSDPGALEALMERADALVLTGGDFDVDPGLFGEAPHEKLGTLKPERTAFERALLERALARSLPVLGVCGGMQLMNVLRRGGTLWQDLGSQFGSAVEHQQVQKKTEPGHDVDVALGTRLHAIVGTARLGVNSTHHQAVRALGEGLVAAAVADDGIVEAFEDPALPFFVGVQWHPEAMPDERQQGIYRALVEASRARG